MLTICVTKKETLKFGSKSDAKVGVTETRAPYHTAVTLRCVEPFFYKVLVPMKYTHDFIAVKSKRERPHHSLLETIFTFEFKISR